MEKEIKVRKKRFAAFWVAVLIVCGMVVPMAVNAEVDNGVLTDETTLEAGIKIRADKITYQDDKGNILLTSSQEESGGWQTIKKYTDIQKDPLPEGYEFDVWEVTANSGNTMEYDKVQYPASVTLKAKTKIGTYTITFDTVDGSPIEPIKQEYNTAVTAPAAPTKTGYTFTGWKPEIPPTMPAGGITITAQWTPNTYHISYEVYGGTHANTATSYTYGVGIESFADAEKDGYTFAGWYSDAAFTTKVEFISKTTIDDITLYAKFELASGNVGAGTYYLKKNTQYQLDGVTKVNDDTSEYVSGSTFYVPADGSYTFN